MLFVDRFRRLSLADYCCWNNRHDGAIVAQFQTVTDFDEIFWYLWIKVSYLYLSTWMMETTAT